MIAERASINFMFMPLLYHSLAEQNSSSADAADEQNECEAVEDVLLGHVVLLVALMNSLYPKFSRCRKFL